MKGAEEKKAWLTARGFFDKYISADNFTLTYAHTLLTPGTPLNINGKRYMNKTDGKKEQTKVYEDFARFLKEDIKGLAVDGGYDASLFATILLFDEFGAILIKDAAFAVFSCTFVFFYLAFHLQSCFLALVGITLILTSFPFTVVITEGIF